MFVPGGDERRAAERIGVKPIGEVGKGVLFVTERASKREQADEFAATHQRREFDALLRIESCETRFYAPAFGEWVGLSGASGERIPTGTVRERAPPRYREARGFIAALSCESERLFHACAVSSLVSTKL